MLRFRAYEVLSDEPKRREYDEGPRDPFGGFGQGQGAGGFGGFSQGGNGEFYYSSSGGGNPFENIGDLFKNMGMNGGGFGQRQHNAQEANVMK